MTTCPHFIKATDSRDNKCHDPALTLASTASAHQSASEHSGTIKVAHLSSNWRSNNLPNRRRLDGLGTYRPHSGGGCTSHTCCPAGGSASVKPAAQTAVIDSGPGGRRGSLLRRTLTGKARILILVSFLGPPLLRLDMVASSVGSCIHMKVFSQEGQLRRLVRGAADERSLHLEAPRPGTESLLLTVKRQISWFFAQQWRTTYSSHCAELTHSKSRERWAVLKQTGVFKNKI